MLGLEDWIDLVTRTAAQFLRHGRHSDDLVRIFVQMLLLLLQRRQSSVVVVDRGQHFIAALMLLITTYTAYVVNLRKYGLLSDRCIPVAHLLILLIQGLKYALFSLKIDIGGRTV